MSLFLFLTKKYLVCPSALRKQSCLFATIISSQDPTLEINLRQCTGLWSVFVFWLESWKFVGVHASVCMKWKASTVEKQFLIGTPHTTDRHRDRSKIKFYNKMFFNYFLLFIHPLFNFFFIAQVLCLLTRRLSRKQDNKYTSTHSDSYRLIASTYEDTRKLLRKLDVTRLPSNVSFLSNLVCENRGNSSSVKEGNLGSLARF